MDTHWKLVSNSYCWDIHRKQGAFHSCFLRSKKPRWSWNCLQRYRRSSCRLIWFHRVVHSAHFCGATVQWMRVMYTGDSHGCFATWVTQWAVVPHIPPPRACSHHQSISQPRKYANTAKQINLSWLYDKGNPLRSFEHAKTTWWNDKKLNEESCLWNMKHQRNISSLKPTTVDVGLTTLAPSRLIHWSSQKSLPLPFQLALNVDLRLLPSLGLNQTKKIQKVPRYGLKKFKCVWFLSLTKVAEECWRLSVWQLGGCGTMRFEF